MIVVKIMLFTVHEKKTIANNVCVRLADTHLRRTKKKNEMNDLSVCLW